MRKPFTYVIFTSNYEFNPNDHKKGRPRHAL